MRLVLPVTVLTLLLCAPAYGQDTKDSQEKVLGQGPLENIFATSNADVTLDVYPHERFVAVDISGATRAHRKAATTSIRTRGATISKCARGALSKEAKPASMKLEAVINGSGEVASVRSTDNQLGEKFFTCFEDALEKGRYPKRGRADKTTTLSVKVRWTDKPGGFDAKMNVAMSGDGGELKVGRGAGGMGLRGTTSNEGFGRIHGLGKVDTGDGNTQPKRQRVHPTLKIENLTVTGPLEQSSVTRVIRAKSNALKYCYERELQLAPDLKGSVAMILTISPKGRVTPKVASSTLNNKKVEGCLTRVHKRMRFEKFDSGEVVAKFSIDFDSK